MLTHGDPSYTHYQSDVTIRLISLLQVYVSLYEKINMYYHSLCFLCLRWVNSDHALTYLIRVHVFIEEIYEECEVWGEILKDPGTTYSKELFFFLVFDKRQMKRTDNWQRYLKILHLKNNIVACCWIKFREQLQIFNFKIKFLTLNWSKLIKV